MTYEQIANLIPREYRDDILEKDMINKAQAVNSDNTMLYLHTIWKSYVDSMIGDCALCLQKVLNNYRQLQPVLISLAKNEKLLDGI